ncbi:MAG: HAMP domain-containing sensor histidine kinase [Terriglobia bacterium]
MNILPIRVKLTLWYFAVLAVTFAVFGTVAYFVMRHSIVVTVDKSLRDQAVGIRALIMRIPNPNSDKVGHELREHAELAEESNLWQVSDKDGHWIFRSTLMERYGVPVSSAGKPALETRRFKHRPFRMLTSEVPVGGETYFIQVATPMHEVFEALEDYRWLLLLLSPALLIFASAGGYWMSRKALLPVDEISRAAQSITHQNISKRLLVPQSHDELQRLSETLNGMLDRLEAAFRKIIQFTADASHEIRTPVSLMRTTAELALRKPRTEEGYREALAQILKELERTSVLIEELMLLARADSGTQMLNIETLDLSETLRDVCNEGRTLAEGKEVDIRWEIPTAPLLVEGDPNALHRLFLILIDNGVKYTPENGQVTMSLKTRNGFAVTEIHDTGLGIAEADIPHIFERFYRADKARSRDSGGAGLGLSIGRWIAEAHGGTIEAESTLGRGSLFRVRLPLSNV